MLAIVPFTLLFFVVWGLNNIVLNKTILKGADWQKMNFIEQHLRIVDYKEKHPKQYKWLMVLRKIEIGARIAFKASIVATFFQIIYLVVTHRSLW